MRKQPAILGQDAGFEVCDPGKYLAIEMIPTRTFIPDLLLGLILTLLLTACSAPQSLQFPWQITPSWISTGWSSTRRG